VRLFVTVGLEPRPFDRLLKAVDLGIERRIFPLETLVQRGHSNYAPERCPSVPFLPYDEMVRALQSAEVVIAHAGVGTLLQCLHQKKIPILYPRRARLGEHVDDHQIMFAQVIEARKRALVAYDPERLFEVYEVFPRLAAGLSGTACPDNGGMHIRRYLEETLRRLEPPGA
jgi:UDP-N-acetylglucosamine transferase subunit ALG13